MHKNFNFAEAERAINKKWLDGEVFKAKIDKGKTPYTIIMPPPNITSRLHIGHAFTSTIQDTLIRFKRMQGFEALLLPGADHAAIATEAKVVDELARKGISKGSLSREEFMTHIQKWYDFYTPQIVEQFKSMGMSADWSRFAFTMNEQTTRAVKRVFKNLHDKGLIYRGERMINFCPNCKTALSDAEVEFDTRERTLYELKYPLESGEGAIHIATTRPETIFADVALGVNPNDARYKKLVGKRARIPLTDRFIPIIADDYIDIEFGTGVLKITPAHAQADYDISIRHNLKVVNIIDADGKLMGEDLMPRELIGLDVDSARKETNKLLEKEGTLVKTSTYMGNIGHCYRCMTTVEPTISKQWFVKMETLAKPCIEALGNGLEIVPKKYAKVYLHWLNNIKDWCISRQLLSGHRIPAYTCNKCGVEVVSETELKKCSCGGEYVQDADVLDTWFSSALWPICTLGYPDKTADFEYFYPTQTLVTAYDILFFWVIRMLFSGIEHTGKIPFSTVLMHGLVRDIKGRKMSKSLGNGIDPVEVINKYGTDALRFSLLCGSKLDRDPRYSIEKAELARNFINKIWNATKFLRLMQDSEKIKIDTSPNFASLSLSDADKWILAKLNSVVRSTTKLYEKFDFGIVCANLQTFFWNDVCDWYVELVKVSPNRAVSVTVLGYVIVTFLKLINPIMPFVTEQIYCSEFALADTLSFEAFPQYDKSINFTKQKRAFERIIELVTAIRANKASNPETSAYEVEFLIDVDTGAVCELTRKLCKVEINKVDKTNADFAVEIASVRAVIDETLKKQKIEAQIAKLQAEIARGEKLLSNSGFLAKAPKSLIEEEQSKLKTNQKLLQTLKK